MRGTLSKALLSLSAICLLSAAVGCHEVQQMTGIGVIQPEKKMMLFNGKDFSGLERFIPDVSVNVDDVWQVKDGVIHCTGKPNGFIRTKSDFANYHLHLEWRWVDEPTNSGVLLHATGPDKVWPKCIEAQRKRVEIALAEGWVAQAEKWLEAFQAAAAAAQPVAPQYGTAAGALERV